MTIEQRIKAFEIFLKMYNVSDPLNKYPMCFDTAKRCSIISVNLIIESLGTLYLGGNQNAFEYWFEIRDFLVYITKENLEQDANN